MGLPLYLRWREEFAQVSEEFAEFRKTLRFEDERQERAFVASRQAHLSRLFLLVSLSIISGLVFVTYLTVRRHQQGAQVYFDPKGSGSFVGTVLNVGYPACAVPLLPMIVVFCHQGLLRRFGPVELEHVALSCMACCTFMICLVDTWYTTKLLGLEPAEVFKQSPEVRFTDSLVVVKVLGINSGFSLFPVRWKMALTVQFIHLGVYTALAICLGSAEPGNVPFVLVVCLVAVICLGIGMRSKERQERDIFLTVISERVLRCETEMKLEGVLQKAEQQDPHHRSEHMEMEAIDEDDDDAVVASLEAIVEVGRQEHWLIEDTDMDFTDEVPLGKGGFGTVVAARYHGMPVAAKAPNKMVKTSKSTLAALGLEIRLLRRLRHAHIVSFHGACVALSSRRLVLVTEYVHGPILGKFVEMQPADAARAQVILGIALALRYLHCQKPAIVHGDIKDSNVIIELLKDEARPKLLDFGFSRLLTPGAAPLGGTLRWMAPELLTTRTPPATPADIFSFGRLIHFVCTGSVVLQGLELFEIRHMALARAFPKAQWESSQPLAPLEKVVDRCTCYEPERRLSVVQLHDEILQTVANFLVLRTYPISGTAVAHARSSSEKSAAAFMELCLEKFEDSFNGKISTANNSEKASKGSGNSSPSRHRKICPVAGDTDMEPSAEIVPIA